jgi:hypothetical protein
MVVQTGTDDVGCKFDVFRLYDTTSEIIVKDGVIA